MSFWKKSDDSDEQQSSPESTAKKPAASERSEEVKPAVQSRPVGKHAAQGAPDCLEGRFGKVRSALSEGTVIQGKLSFDTPVRIDGKLSGEIFSTEALIVGEKGEIDADVDVASLIVMGSVKGTVKARNRVELMENSKLEGKLQTPTLVMETGALFDGTCEMGGSAAVAAEKKAEAAAGETADQENSSEKQSEVRVH